MGSIIGHRIECNGVGALRGHTYPAKINSSNPPGCQYRSKTIMKMCLVAFVFFALTGLLFSPHKRLRVLFWDILHQCKVGCLKTVRKENNLAKSLRVVSFRLFTVLYFSVRSSRSSTLRFGLHLAWVSKLRYIWKSRWPSLTVRRAISQRSHEKIGDCEQSKFHLKWQVAR